LVELVLKLCSPPLLPALIGGEQLAGENPEVLAGMVDINDLNHARKLAIGDVPDPYSSIAEDDPEPCMVTAFLQGFGAQSSAETFGRINVPGISGGSLVAQGMALLIEALSG
jgi:hypothetical protein